MKCPGCDNDARKGSLVMLLDPRSGKHERKRVCNRCVSRALLVAAPLQTPIVKGRIVMRTAGDDLLAMAIRTLTTYIKAIDASPSAGDHQAGRREGLETALELLRRAVAS